MVLPSDKKLVLQTLNAIQGLRTAGKIFNEKIDRILRKDLGFNKCASDYGACIWVYKEKDLVIMNLSTDDFLIATANEEARSLIEETISSYYQVKIVNERMFNYLNWRIIQSDVGISIDQCEHIVKTLRACFPEDKPKSCHVPFRTDSVVEDDFFNAHPCTVESLLDLESEFGASYPHMHGKILHINISSRPDIAYALARLGYFQSVQCRLGFESIKRVLRYLATHLNKPLVFRKGLSRDSVSSIRAFWSRNEFEDFSFANCLAAHQDSSFSPDKILRSSFAGIMHTILGTIIDWKVKKLILPINSTDAEVRILCLSLLRTKIIRTLLLNMGLPVGKPTPHYEDNSAAIQLVQAHRVTPRLRHIDIPLCYLHMEHQLGTFRVEQRPSRFMMADFLTKPHSGPSLLRLSSWSMGHQHLASLPTWHLEALSSFGPISTLPSFLPSSYDHKKYESPTF